MATSDLDQLIDMGFERERAEMAVQQAGGLQGAIDWLDQHQDQSLEEIKTEQQESEGPALQPGEEPKSLVCNECGKKFRSQAQAEFHASKTEHVDFAESTEEVAPLTEEEKKARLEELRERLATKRAGRSEQDKADQKRNEQIRRKATKESQDIKEELQRKERIKEAEAKRREKQDEIDAKKRIQAKIAADKEERRRKAEQEKANREAQTFSTEPLERSMPPGTAIPRPAVSPSDKTTTATPTAKAQAYTEGRLRLQTPNGTLQKSFPADTTLFEVAHWVAEQNGHQVASFSMNFPKKSFDTGDFGMTLVEAGFVPSAALIIK